jgi:hypothetical protein
MLQSVNYNSQKVLNSTNASSKHGGIQPEVTSRVNKPNLELPLTTGYDVTLKQKPNLPLPRLASKRVWRQSLT